MEDSLQEYVITITEDGKQVIHGIYADRQQAYDEWSSLSRFGFQPQLWEIPAGLRDYLLGDFKESE